MGAAAQQGRRRAVRPGASQEPRPERLPRHCSPPHGALQPRNRSNGRALVRAGRSLQRVSRIDRGDESILTAVVADAVEAVLRAHCLP